jgi:CRISPR-associated protein Csx14
MTQQILIATLGTSPQIVTTTIDLLLQKKIFIDHVCILHTSSETNNAIKNSIDIIKKDFDNQKQYKHLFTYNLIPITDDEGNIIDDLDNTNRIDCFFRLMAEQMSKYKNENSIIHMQCSGGRKAMSMYGISVAQILFDENDKFWYLISFGQYFENAKMHIKSPEDLTEVNLLEIPILPLNNISPWFTNTVQNQSLSEAFENAKRLSLRSKYEKARDFVEGNWKDNKGNLRYGVRRLTKVERETLDALHLPQNIGATSRELAEYLYKTNRTVESTLRNLYGKAEAFWSDGEAIDVHFQELIHLTRPYYENKNMDN